MNSEFDKKRGKEKMNITEGMVTGISLKTLYENGCEYLKYGGHIVHTSEDENDFYDLYQDGVEHNLLLCDGEEVEVLQKTTDSIMVEVPETNCKIWFTPEEFGIAVFASL